MERIHPEMIKRISLTIIAITFASLAFYANGALAAQKDSELNAKDVIKPKQLLTLLSGTSQERPFVLQVGFSFLYDSGHIDGAIHAGPAMRPDGIKKLRAAVKDVPKDRMIVIYCGCCPWPECPNVRPAYAFLSHLGFRNVKTLYIPINFERDWIKKGYPITKGSKPTSR